MNFICQNFCLFLFIASKCQVFYAAPTMVGEEQRNFLTEQDFEEGRMLRSSSTAQQEDDISLLENQNHFEGDILGLDFHGMKQMVALTNQHDRKALRLSDSRPMGQRVYRSVKRQPAHRLWSNAVIPYTICTRFTKRQRAAIAKAFEHIQNHTCLQFTKRNPLVHPDYIHLAANGSGCASHIGKQGGEQLVSLDPQCFSNTSGTIIHELLHAVGFVHEQSRADRDFYVKVLIQNVRAGRTDDFKKYDLNRIKHLGAPYDYGSIMHYGRKAFGLSPPNTNTLTTLIPTNCGGEGIVMGQRTGLSHYDAFKINKLYGCPLKPDDCIDAMVNCAHAGSAACRNSHAYLGLKRTTVTGRTCQAWNKQTPHRHLHGNLYGNDNYCRNLHGSKDAPWCYTQDPKVRWEYCFSKCPSEQNHAVRLVSRDGRKDQPFGRVEILHNGTWGTIGRNRPTFKAWDDGLAKVVCRMLGWPSDFASAYTQKEFLPVTGPVWLNRSRCLGSEVHIEECRRMRYNQWKLMDHTNDVGVRCYCPPSSEGDAQADFSKATITTTGNLSVETSKLSYEPQDAGHCLQHRLSVAKFRFFLSEIPLIANLHITHPKSIHRPVDVPGQSPGYPPVEVAINGHKTYLFHVVNTELKDRIDGAVLPSHFLKNNTSNLVKIKLISGLRRRRTYCIQKIKITWHL